jgi:hypothetical protein
VITSVFGRVANSRLDTAETRRAKSMSQCSDQRYEQLKHRDMEARIRRSNLHLIKASIVKKRAQKRKNS